MTDAFTQTIANEVATLLQQQGQQILNLSAQDETAFQLTPQQVLEVMQGNSQWLSQFETELDITFRRVADNALDYWLKNTDKEIRDSLRALAKIADILLDQAQSNSFAGSSSGGSSATSDPFVNALGDISKNLSSSLFKDLFSGGERTSISETARSQETAGRYQSSRGQTQAEMSKQLSRGARYT